MSGAAAGDDTLKQITLALFGAETTRVSRSFISSMMLLDNIQNEIYNYASGDITRRAAFYKCILQYIHCTPYSK